MERVKLPSFDIPKPGYDLIAEFMRKNGIKSQSEAIRLLLEESPSLREIAAADDLSGVFSLGGRWGGYRRGEKAE